MRHIDDLSPSDAVVLIEKLPSSGAQEKYDGADLIFGRSAQGKFYTTTDNPEWENSRVYDSQEYLEKPSQFILAAAHEALSTSKVAKTLQSGKTAEVEIVIPQDVSASTVAYRKAQIIVVGGIDKVPTEQVTLQLKVPAVSGNTITFTDVALSATVSAPKTFEDIELSQGTKDLIAKAKKYLKSVPEIEINLKSVDPDVRDEVDSARGSARDAFVQDYLSPLKASVLVDVFGKAPSALTYEGLVINSGGSLVKLVDKSSFTKINEQAKAFKKLIHSGLYTSDSVMDSARVRILTVLGYRAESNASHLKSVSGGVYDKSTILSFLASAGIRDVPGAKSSILGILQDSIASLNKLAVPKSQDASAYATAMFNSNAVFKQRAINELTATHSMVKAAQQQKALITSIGLLLTGSNKYAFKEAKMPVFELLGSFLREDGDAPTDAPNAPSVPTATMDADIGVIERPTFTSPISRMPVVKRCRNPEIKRRFMKFKKEAQ